MSTPLGRALTRRAVPLLAAGAAVLALAHVTTGAGTPTDTRLVGNGVAAATDRGSAQPAAGSPSRFGISGSVSGLYPGASLPLVLAVSNPQQFTIVVSSITTTVGSASPGCPSANLSVAPFAGSLSVPAQGTATVTVTATMPHSAPGACQGAIFPLAYAGLATKP